MQFDIDALQQLPEDGRGEEYAVERFNTVKTSFAVTVQTSFASTVQTSFSGAAELG